MFFQLQHTKWPGPQCGISAYIHGWTVSQVNLISSRLSQWWKAFDKEINACNLCCFGWLSLLLYLHSSTIKIVFETNRCSGDSEDKVNSECPTSPPLSHACDTISEESEETVNTKASTVVHAGTSQVDTGQKVSSSSALFLLKLSLILNFLDIQLQLSCSLLPLSSSLLPLPPSLLPLSHSFLSLPFSLLPLPLPSHPSPLPLLPLPLPSYLFLVPLHPISLPTYPSPVPFNPFPLPSYPSPVPFNPFPLPFYPSSFPLIPPLFPFYHSPFSLPFPLTPPSFPFTPSPFPLTPPQFPLIPSPFSLTPPPVPFFPYFLPFYLFLLDLRVLRMLLTNILFQCASSYNHPQAYLHSNIPTLIHPKSILL